MAKSLDDIYVVFDEFGRGTSEFTGAVRSLKKLAEDGNLAAAEELAELMALPGIYHDPGSAYFWYYIVLSQQGYTTALVEQAPAALNYVGPVGDFRNESIVSLLVSELGLKKIKQIDLIADAWIKSNIPK